MPEAHDALVRAMHGDDAGPDEYLIEVRSGSSTDFSVPGHRGTRLTVDVRDGTHLCDVLAWLWSLGVEVEAIKRLSSTDR